MAALNIRDYLQLNRTPGDIGIEIEMEGDRPFPDGTAIRKAGWTAEEDGSLRGYSKEYILTVPVKIDEVAGHIKTLKQLIKDASVTIAHSFRAGVHVHVNVQQLTSYQVGTMAAIYYCLERALVKYCGPGREGNHFCLRAEDAEYSMWLLQDALINGIGALGTDNIRYSSMNLRAITRYGSIEFRAMETLPDLSKIEDWATMLYRIREAAVACKDRRDLAYNISFNGPEGWASNILGPDLYKLIHYDGIEKDIMRGLRMCQSIVYLGDSQ